METTRQTTNIKKTRLDSEQERDCGKSHMIESALEKKKGDAQIVVAMVMIVIALVLCFLFKDQITTFMTTAITTMSTKMSTLLNGLN